MPFRPPLYSKLFTHQGRIFQSVLAAVVFTLCALGITLCQTKTVMEQDAVARLVNVKTALEQSLDNAHQAAMSLKDTLGKPCDKVGLLLDEQVISGPEVRTISLSHGDTIYCNSLRGLSQRRFALDTYVDGRLKIASDDSLTPGNPVIFYRLAFGQDSVVVILHGRYLLNSLNLLSGNSPLTLVVGQHRWQHDQPLTNQVFPLASPGYLEEASTKYPFRIITKYSNEQMAAFFWHQAKGSLIAFPVLGILLGLLVFRLTGRLGSPVRELQVALSKQEFIPYLQPVVWGEERALDGCEVLMRWQHPELGMIAPDHFIPTAEASGLIVPMTRSLMGQVQAALAPYQQQLPEKFAFGFNIGAPDFRDMSLVADCRRFLDAFREKRITLVLELTERELLVADDVTNQLFTELRELGVLIAIDDFGTGHSSLTYLQQFNVDILKIDQSFVSLIGTDALSRHIVDNVIDLATRLDLKTVAEGVETNEQADYLFARKVDLQQGYFHGRPMPMAEFIKQWLC